MKDAITSLAREQIIALYPKVQDILAHSKNLEVVATCQLELTCSQFMCLSLLERLVL